MFDTMSGNVSLVLATQVVDGRREGGGRCPGGGDDAYWDSVGFESRVVLSCCQWICVASLKVNETDW